MTEHETRALMVFPIKRGEARIALLAEDSKIPNVMLEVDGKSITLDEWEWDRITDSINRMFDLVADDFSTHGSGGNDAV